LSDSGLFSLHLKRLHLLLKRSLLFSKLTLLLESLKLLDAHQTLKEILSRGLRDIDGVVVRSSHKN
jgi:hypothetical protein